MGVLAPLLRACSEGRGQTVVISGAVGLGKTALLEAMADRGAAEGFAVLSAVGSRALGSSPFQLFDDLFHGVEGTGVGAGEQGAEPGADQPGSGPPAALLAMARCYDRALRRLSADRPVMICVDDLQYFDPQSVQCLLHLAQRCSRMPVAILLTSGPTDDLTHQALLAELAGRPRVRWLRLRALTQAEVHGLTAERFSVAAADRLAPPVFEASGGNHLLVRSLLDDHGSLLPVDGGPRDRSAVGTGDLFRAASLACVYRSGAEALRVARAGAVLDGAGSASVLAALVELPQRAVDNALRGLEEARLFRLGRFRSAAVRDAVLADIPLAQRAELHRRAGGLLAEDGQRALVVARHLLAAGPVEGGHCVAVLLEAADQALAEDDVSLATRSLRLAEVSCQNAQQRDQVRQARARVSGRGRPAAPAEPPGPQQWNSMRSLWAVLHGSAVESDVVGAERVLQRLPPGDATMDTLSSALMTLVYADRLKPARSWCDSFLPPTPEPDAPTWQVMLTSVRALISLRQGRLQQAEELAAGAFHGLTPEVWGNIAAMPLSTLVAARTAIGDHEGVAQLVERPIPELWLQTRFGVHYLYARGQHHLARGRCDLALADFLACGERLTSWQLDSPAFVPWRVGVVRVLLLRGQQDQAAALAAEHLALVRPGQRRTHGIALRTLAATRRPAARIELLTEAVQVLEAAGDSFKTALALADLGRAQEECGARDDARLSLGHARRLARYSGATALASSLDGGGEPRLLVKQLDTARTEIVDANALSKAELRVSALAAEGYTNREISGKLFITVSTVEQHLTRAYRKLNISRRRDLPGTLDQLQN